MQVFFVMKTMYVFYGRNKDNIGENASIIGTECVFEGKILVRIIVLSQDAKRASEIIFIFEGRGGCTQAITFTAQLRDRHRLVH